MNTLYCLYFIFIDVHINNTITLTDNNDHLPKTLDYPKNLRTLKFR